MNTKYIDLIEQTFDFPQEEFKTEKGNLYFHDKNKHLIFRKKNLKLKREIYTFTILI